MSKDIAIIGMAGRFPDARNLDELAENLEQGKDSIREITPERLKATTLNPDKKYRCAGYLDDIDKFDHAFFNISLGEAQAMDPMQRLLLEVAYETIENAGYNPDDFNGSRTAVFVGDASTDYYKHADQFMDTLVTGNSPAFFATRITRVFNLIGNAVMINTACSSSGVAIHMACGELLLGEADCVLACGVNLYLFPYYDSTNELDIWSPDGKSRAFSAHANGMSNGEVVAAVLLKPLDKALEDNDHIHAVIEGTAINNNANRSDSPYAPDSITQAEVIKLAWEKAGVGAEDIGFIETHGSGTQLGDTLEFEGLTLAFRDYTDKTHICPISAIKSTTGHGMSGAGICGLIKAVLSLKRRVLFPAIHFDTPNPMIDFEHSALYVNTRRQPWNVEPGKTRLAGVTTLGASGTNHHVVLSEAPSRPSQDQPENGSPYIFAISSGTSGGLKENIRALHGYLANGCDRHAGDISYTLCQGRKHYHHRIALLAHGKDELLRRLEPYLERPAASFATSPELTRLIFIFSPPIDPGAPLEANGPRDGLEGTAAFFRRRYPVFRQAEQECRDRAAALEPGEDPGVRRRLDIFSFQYAFFRLLEALGIRDRSRTNSEESGGDLLGIGPGREVTAVLDGDLSLDQALHQALTGSYPRLTDIETRLDALVERETADSTVFFIGVGPESPLSLGLKQKQDGGDSRFGIFDLCTAIPPQRQIPELVRRLYLANYPVDWEGYYRHHPGGRRTELPGYQFQKTRCWLRETPRPDEQAPDMKLFNENERYLDVRESQTHFLKEAEGTEIQRKLAAYWCEVLETEQVSRQDNFFDIGGDSLKATRVINSLRQDFNVQLDFEDIFDFPVLEQLAGFIDGLWGTEERVAAIWKEVLKAEEVKPGDSFFDLGGHSLLANQVLVRVKREFNLELNFEDLFSRPTLSKFAQLIDTLSEQGARRADYRAIEKIPDREDYGVSPSQRRLWVLSRLEEGSVAYNTSFAFLMKGALNRDVLGRVFDTLVRRHESLRTVYLEKEGLPRQKVLSPREAGVELETVEVRGEPLPEEAARRIIARDTREPFDIGIGPVIRIKLIRLEEDTHVFNITAHHIVNDGWSMDLLFNEVAVLYNAYLDEAEAGGAGAVNTGGGAGREPLPPLSIQYKDAAAWQNRRLESESFAEHRRYWLEQLSGELPVSEMPIDRPRPMVQSFEGDRVQFVWNPAVTAGLRALTRQADGTLFMVLLSLAYALFYRYTRQEDMILGTAVAGRKHPDLENQVGFYVNTLALRTRFLPSWSFRQWVEAVKQTCLGAYRHEEYPFDRLVEEVNIKRDLARNPLFDVMVSLQNTDVFSKQTPELRGLDIQYFENRETASLFDMEWEFFETREPGSGGETITGHITYNTALFNRDRIEALVAHLGKLAESALADPDQPVRDIPMLGEEELLLLLNNLQEHPDQGETFRYQGMTALIRRWAAEKPEAIALSCDGRELSYAELREKANRLGHLLKARGIAAGSLVAICCRRSIDMAVGILGVWCAGGAYIPLDPGDPVDRTGTVLKDSGAPVMLLDKDTFTQETALEDLMNQCPQLEHPVYLDDMDSRCPEEQNPSFNTYPAEDLPDNLPGDLAYVIYTSGSTGTPKGAMVEHRGMMNHIQAKIRDLDLTAGSVVAQNASHTFDISVWQFFAALAVGGRTAVYTRERILDPRLFISALVQDGVTILEVVPSYLSVFLDALEDGGGVSPGDLPVNYLLVTGETVKPELLKRWFRVFPHIEVVNAYGPTEASDDITHHLMASAPAGERVPIGKPLRHFRIYILDEHNQLCPAGIRGEICVSGTGVGRGYLNRPLPTEDRFIPNPFAPRLPGAQHPVIYRTGDLGTWRNDGAIDFFGRLDYQVKIRGFRIELGEIENRLAEHPAVEEACVVDREDAGGQKYLCAYYRAAEPLEDNNLRTYLQRRLPDYMVPAYLVWLEQLPLTPNGKIDRRALPAPDIPAGPAKTGPRDPMEETLLELWAGVLGLEPRQIGIDGDLFELGGHSLKATVLISRIHKAFEVKVPLVEMFRNTTVRQLAQYLKKAEKETFTSLETVEKRAYYPLSPVQQRLFFIQHMEPENRAYNLYEVLRLKEPLQAGDLEPLFQRLLERHESLRTSFHLVDEVPVQKIHAPAGPGEADPGVDFQVVEYDISGSRSGPAAQGESQELPETAAREFAAIMEHLVRPFHLDRAPLLRVGLIDGGGGYRLLVAAMHHIISDGVSIALLMNDFTALYRGEELAPPAFHYKDYCRWQQRVKETGQLQSQEQYWLEVFSPGIPQLDLPIDFPRPDRRDSAGDTVAFEIPVEETAALNRMARGEQATLYMVLLAAFNVLLAKLCRAGDILVGTPVAGRRHAELENIIGMFVNTLVLRNFPAAEDSFRDFLAQTGESTLKAFENQDVPFDHLVHLVDPPRQTGRNILFDVMFVLQNMDAPPAGPGPGGALFDRDPGPFCYENKSSQFDLTLFCTEEFYPGKSGESHLTCFFQYATGLFQRETIEKFAGYFREIIGVIVENKEIKLEDIRVSHDLIEPAAETPDIDFAF